MTQSALPESTTLRDHWWPRPGWRPGRIAYTWHLTFEGAEELHRLVSDVQQRLAGLPGLDVIPRQWLHLTLQTVGYTDSTSDSTVRGVIDTVRARVAQVPAFDLVFQQPVIVGEAIILPSTPTEPVQELWHAVRSGIADAVGEDRVDTAPEQAHGFLPHVSVAYSRINSSARPYRTALDARPVEPANVHIGQISLIRQERVLEPEWVYRWEPEAVAPLAD